METYQGGIPKRKLSEIEFAKATALAARDGFRRNPSADNSFVQQDIVSVADEQGQVIVLYPISSVKPISESPGPRAIGDRAQAIAWARSMGYPVPKKTDFGCLTFVLVVLGFLAFLLPGILILLWIAYSDRAYDRDIDILVARWVDAGRPEPGVKMNVGHATVRTGASAPFAERLREYDDLLREGLVSPEEFEALRKKILGL